MQIGILPEHLHKYFRNFFQGRVSRHEEKARLKHGKTQAESLTVGSANPKRLDYFKKNNSAKRKKY